jgi:TatD DNase family protein
MTTVLSDSHCHLNLLELSRLGMDLDGVVQAARSVGVRHMLNVCVDLESFPEVAAVAQRYEGVSASVGVHPNAKVAEEPTIETLVQLADCADIVAIGETGLDYYRSQGDLGWQHERFRRHVGAAREVGKPLIVHSRSAREGTLRLLEEQDARAVGGVMHCFAEDWDTAARAMDLGFYISFSGIVTFRNADDLRAVAARVPVDRLLVETDAPYLAPVPRRGKSNQPANVLHVLERIAELREMQLDELAAATTRNYLELFHPSGPAR